MYNLTVADCPEYFANGILVHNCSYAYNTWRSNSEKPARTALQEKVQEMRREGMDETTIARVAWNMELKIQAEEKQQSQGITLGKKKRAKAQ